MKKISAFILLICFGLTVWSQTTDEIINKYINSIGGKEKWKAVKTAKLIGSLPTPQGDFTFEMLRKSPNKYIISVEVMGQKLIPQAYDGVTAWTVNPFAGVQGPQKLPEDQAKAAQLESEFEDPFIDYSSKGYEVSLLENQTVDGAACYVVKLIKNKGNAEKEQVMTYFFDNQTYLPILVKQLSNSGQFAGQEMNVYYSDYKDTGNGLIMPYSIDSKVGGQTVQGIKFTTIAFNEEISDDVFTYKGN